MAKFETPLLDQLESGPWPSFVSDIKQEAAARQKNPKGLEENIKVAKLGGTVAKDARSSYEKVTNKSAITDNNNLNYEHIKVIKQIKV